MTSDEPRNYSISSLYPSKSFGMMPLTSFFRTHSVKYPLLSCVIEEQLHPGTMTAAYWMVTWWQALFSTLYTLNSSSPPNNLLDVFYFGCNFSDEETEARGGMGLTQGDTAGVWQNRDSNAIQTAL